MSEDKPTIKLKTLKQDSIVKVDIGSGFYARAQELLFWYVNQQPAEVSIKALETLKTREPADKFEYHLLTLMSLIYSVEAAAETQGLIEDKDFEIPKKD